MLNHEMMLNGKYARALDMNRFGSKEEAVTFLMAMQSYAYELLRVNGRLFLNDVYEKLDLPTSEVGKHVGWVYHENDSCISFDIWPIRVCGDFILLDFNVDGIID